MGILTPGSSHSPTRPAVPVSRIAYLPSSLPPNFPEHHLSQKKHSQMITWLGSSLHVSVTPSALRCVQVLLCSYQPLPLTLPPPWSQPSHTLPLTSFHPAPGTASCWQNSQEENQQLLQVMRASHSLQRTQKVFFLIRRQSFLLPAPNGLQGAPRQRLPSLRGRSPWVTSPKASLTCPGSCPPGLHFTTTSLLLLNALQFPG